MEYSLECRGELSSLDVSSTIDFSASLRHVSIPTSRIVFESMLQYLGLLGQPQITTSWPRPTAGAAL